MANSTAGSVVWNLDIKTGDFDAKLAASKLAVTEMGKTFGSADASLGRSFASISKNGTASTSLLQTGIGRAGSAISIVDSKIKNFASGSISRLRPIGSLFGKDLNTGVLNLGSSVGSLITKFSSVAKVAATAGAIVGGITLGSFINSAAQLQQTNAGFQTLIGNTQQANKLFSQLFQYANATPFQAKDITDAARTLTGFGTNAQQTYKYIKQIGDVSGATGGDMQGLALVTGQIFAQGKLRAQDFYQIINSGAGALGPLIAKNLGLNGVGALSNAFQKGDVSASAFFAALQQATDKGGVAFQGAEKQAQTFNGRLSTLKDAATQAGLKLLGVKVDPKLGLMVQSGGLFDRLSRYMVSIIGYLSSPSFQVFASTVGNVLGKAINGLVTGFSTATKIISGWVNGFKSGNPLIQGATVFIVALAAGLAIYNIAIAVAAAATGIFGAVLALVTSPVFLIAAAIAAVIAIGYILITHWGTIKKVGSDAFGAVKDAVSSAFNWVKKNWPLLLAIITGPIGIAVLAVVKNWDKIKSAASSALSGVVSFFSGLPGRIVRAVGNLGGTLYNTGKNLIQGLLNGAGSLLSSIGQFFLNKLPGWIRTPFRNALGIHSPSTVFAGYGKNLIQGLANGMNGAQSLVDSAVGDLSNKLDLTSTMSLGMSANGYGSVIGASLAAPASQPTTTQQPVVIHLHQEGIVARSRADFRDIMKDGIEAVNEELRARRLPQLGNGAISGSSTAA
jgi:tape measure domain-containing protein